VEGGAAFESNKTQKDGRQMKRLILLCAVLMMLYASSSSIAQTISRVTPLTATGTLNATTGDGSTVTLGLGGYTGVAVQLTGTCGTCTVNFETTLDGSNWVALNMTPPDSTTAVTSASDAGVWKGATIGTSVRARMSARSSGSFVVTMRATAFSASAGGGGSTPGGSDTQVQFNDGGVFGGSDHLRFNTSKGQLRIGPDPTGILENGGLVIVNPNAPTDYSNILYATATEGGVNADVLSIDTSGDADWNFRDSGVSLIFHVRRDGVTPYNLLKISEDGIVVTDPGGNPVAARLQIYPTDNIVQIGGSDGSTAVTIYGAEVAAPAAPSANGYVIFAQDNGSGKTQLCARFATGASQCFATQP
jgi:hypothetical protein